MYLMNVNCSSYIHGLRARLGYFPNGGTMRLKTRAMHTNTAGRTICNGKIKCLSKLNCIDYISHNSERCVYLSEEAFP